MTWLKVPSYWAWRYVFSDQVRALYVQGIELAG